jgi:hypothetical protein
MKKHRRGIEMFSMSFLDVISCGFGAVILLLVLSLALEPATVQKITEDLRGLITQRNDARDQHIQESQALSGELAGTVSRISAISKQINTLKRQFEIETARASGAESTILKEKLKADDLKAVQQRLSEEMRRLLSQSGSKPPPNNAVIGGIPVDSEYIIFIVDTSGSMQSLAWPLVVRKVEEVLSIYPAVKGIQVMNDMGRYMLETYKDRWIPDSSARRKAIVDRIKTWKSFSNSSPVEGVVAAIRKFYRADRRISLYIFGDDFTGSNMDDVIEEVARINAKDTHGKPRVRVHAFGFPVLFLDDRARKNLTRFAHLMRLLAENNAGSFVGLNSLK